jgi:competence protein ComGC
MEKKENYIVIKIISVILILYFLNLYYDYRQIKKENENYQNSMLEIKEKFKKAKENNQQVSPNNQIQTKQKNSENNDLRGMDWDKLSEQNKEISRRTQEQLKQNSKLNQNKESPKKSPPLNCTQYKVGGIETWNCQ